MSVYDLIRFSYILPFSENGLLLRIFWPTLAWTSLSLVLLRFADFLGIRPEALPADQHSQLSPGAAILLVAFLVAFSIPYLLAMQSFVNGLGIWVRHLVNGGVTDNGRYWLAPWTRECARTLGLLWLSIGLTFIGTIEVAMIVGHLLASNNEQLANLLTQLDPTIVVIVIALSVVGLVGFLFTLQFLSIIGAIAGAGSYQWYASKKKISLRDRAAFSMALVSTIAPGQGLIDYVNLLPRSWADTAAMAAVVSAFCMALIVTTTMLALFYRYRMAPTQAASAP